MEESAALSIPFHGARGYRPGVDASVDIPRANTGLAGGLRVKLRQAPNTPPTIVASQGAREKVLEDLNPQLKNVRFQRTEEISWLEARAAGEGD